MGVEVVVGMRWAKREGGEGDRRIGEQRVLRGKERGLL